MAQLVEIHLGAPGQVAEHGVSGPLAAILAAAFAAVPYCISLAVSRR